MKKTNLLLYHDNKEFIIPKKINIRFFFCFLLQKEIHLIYHNKINPVVCREQLKLSQGITKQFLLYQQI